MDIKPVIITAEQPGNTLIISIGAEVAAVVSIVKYKGEYLLSEDVAARPDVAPFFLVETDVEGYAVITNNHVMYYVRRSRGFGGPSVGKFTYAVFSNDTRKSPSRKMPRCYYEDIMEAVARYTRKLQ